MDVADVLWERVPETDVLEPGEGGSLGSPVHKNAAYSEAGMHTVMPNIYKHYWLLRCLLRLDRF